MVKAYLATAESPVCHFFAKIAQVPGSSFPNSFQIGFYFRERERIADPRFRVQIQFPLILK